MKSLSSVRLESYPGLLKDKSNHFHLKENTTVKMLPDILFFFFQNKLGLVASCIIVLIYGAATTRNAYTELSALAMVL